MYHSPSGTCRRGSPAPARRA
uniref:Mek1 n=1 Tax=Arundo donax TaxID=35708 RepID=A0A0A9E2W6_ARUDO